MWKRLSLLLLGFCMMGASSASALNDALAYDPALWAAYYGIDVGTGPFTLRGHEYLIEPMRCQAQVAGCKKATQGGFTLIGTLDIAHGCIHQRYPQGALYLFPDRDAVEDFSRTRFNPLIDGNPATIGRYVQGTDTVGVKKIGRAFLYLRGAGLTRSISGIEKESSKLRSIPVDVVIYDEYDLMGKNVRAKAQGRMGHSTIKRERFFSNPTIPGYGIDAYYETSDQRMWEIPCEACGRYTCPEREFPECVAIDADGRGYIRCIHCKRPINRSAGHWEAQFKGRENVGWWWSQLLSTFVDCATIIRELENPPDGNIGDVYRLRLGKAYIEAEHRLTVEQVIARCGDLPMLTSHCGPCAMGVDVGKVLHYVIGYRKNEKQYGIVKLGTVESFSELRDLARAFNVRSEVDDLRPETRAVKEHAEAAPHEVFGCDYKEGHVGGYVFDITKNEVKVNRTEICDESHVLVSRPGVVTYPRYSNTLQEYAEHMAAIAKAKVGVDVAGKPIYRYVQLDNKPDHYRHATNYFLLAARRIGPVTTGAARQRQTHANTHHDPLA